MMPDFTGVHLEERLRWAKAHLAPVQSQYRIAFEANDEAPAEILIPDPNWLAAALHGGILPPIEVYLLAPQVPQALIDGLLQHIAQPAPAMTEPEAIEYLIRRDLPRHVWDPPQRINRLRFRICRAEQIPSNRTYRNAWRLAA